MKTLLLSLLLSLTPILPVKAAGASLQDVSNIVNSMVYGFTNNYNGLSSNIAQIQSNVVALSNVAAILNQERNFTAPQHLDGGMATLYSFEVDSSVANSAFTNFPYYRTWLAGTITNGASGTNGTAQWQFWNMPIRIEGTNNSYFLIQDERFGTNKTAVVSNGAWVIR